MITVSVMRLCRLHQWCLSWFLLWRWDIKEVLSMLESEIKKCSGLETCSVQTNCWLFLWLGVLQGKEMKEHLDLISNGVQAGWLELKNKWLSAGNSETNCDLTRNRFQWEIFKKGWNTKVEKFSRKAKLKDKTKDNVKRWKLHTQEWKKWLIQSWYMKGHCSRAPCWQWQVRAGDGARCGRVPRPQQERKLDYRYTQKFSFCKIIFVD